VFKTLGFAFKLSVVTYFLGPFSHLKFCGFSLLKNKIGWVLWCCIKVLKASSGRQSGERSLPSIWVHVVCPSPRVWFPVAPYVKDILLQAQTVTELLINRVYQLLYSSHNNTLNSWMAWPLNGPSKLKSE
jgi:hypothetical protein